MRILLLVTAISLFAIAIQAEPITGTRVIYIQVGDDGWELGPPFFGYLPEGTITEMAYTEAIVAGQSGDSFPVPLPTYTDGTVALLSEVFFTIQIDNLHPRELTVLEYTWDGGDTLLFETSIHWTWSRLNVKAWAFRQGSVGAAPMDFGVLKTMFE